MEESKQNETCYCHSCAESKLAYCPIFFQIILFQYMSAL